MMSAHPSRFSQTGVRFKVSISSFSTSKNFSSRSLTSSKASPGRALGSAITMARTPFFSGTSAAIGRPVAGSAGAERSSRLNR